MTMSQSQNPYGTTGFASWHDVGVLPDGIYDAFVVWAETVAEDALSIELTVTAGTHKGEMVSVRMRDSQRHPLDLVGLPCRLIVEGGQPRLEL
jgi:hypothetical protein